MYKAHFIQLIILLFINVIVQYSIDEKCVFNYYFIAFLLKEVGSAKADRVINTISVRRPQPHNTNLKTERREMGK